MNQQHLLEGLNSVGPSAERLFSLLPADKLEWRPRENMRTLMEVANHLAQVPAIDLFILEGASQEAVQERERELRRAAPAELAAVWRGGVGAVSAFYGGLSDTEFMTREGKAFYGHVAPLWSWLLDIITHSYHHRAQLFTYLKELGLPVDMATLYG